MSPVDQAIEQIQHAPNLAADTLRPILFELVKDMYCEGIKIGMDVSHRNVMKLIDEAVR